MSAAPRPAHQGRQQYQSLRDALTDLALVSGDIRHLTEGREQVPSDELAFLARRVQRLARSALGAVPGENGDEHAS